MKTTLYRKQKWLTKAQARDIPEDSVVVEHIQYSNGYSEYIVWQAWEKAYLRPKRNPDLPGQIDTTRSRFLVIAPPD